jgi:hypothetical protein
MYKVIEPALYACLFTSTSLEIFIFHVTDISNYLHFAGHRRGAL